MLKRRQYYILAAIVAAGSLLASCSSRGVKETEATEATEAEIEAAQMQGREAAREFVHREWADSLELHRHLLEVGSMRGRYSDQKRYQERDAFDSAFISTVRAVRPGLAEQIERQKP